MPKQSKKNAAHANDAAWGIQEFADLFGITPRAIRFYEDKGLLSPSREAGSRVFGPDDEARMSRILRAKRLGFSLDDIKTVLDVTDGLVTDRQELMRRQRDFEKVIQSLRRRRTDIDELIVEMSALCVLIEKELANTDENSDVILLAKAYDSAFRKHLSHQNKDF